MPVAALAHGRKARLVLNGVVAAADDQLVFGPDDLGADGKAAHLEAGFEPSGSVWPCIVSANSAPSSNSSKPVSARSKPPSCKSSSSIFNSSVCQPAFSA